MVEDYRGSLAQDVLLRDFVPTINEYSQLVTPQLFVMTMELLQKGIRPDNLLNRLPLYAQNPGWQKQYVNLGGALGVRFILSRKELDFSYSTGSSDALRLKDKSILTGKADDQISSSHFVWHLYELPMTNTGNYSPTIFHNYASAPEMIGAMAAPWFDYRRDALVNESIDDKFIPLKELNLSFKRGGAHVKAVSEGKSLALLPLEYSHCLQISDPNAHLLRTDLVFAGLVFSGQLDATITDEFGLFTPGCRAADKADIGRLHIVASDADHPLDSNMHPWAIKSATDLLDKIDGVAAQLK